MPQTCLPHFGVRCAFPKSDRFPHAASRSSQVFPASGRRLWYHRRSAVCGSRRASGPIAQMLTHRAPIMAASEIAPECVAHCPRSPSGQPSRSRRRTVVILGSIVAYVSRCIWPCAARPSSTTRCATRSLGARSSPRRSSAPATLWPHWSGSLRRPVPSLTTLRAQVDSLVHTPHCQRICGSICGLPQRRKLCRWCFDKRNLRWAGGAPA